MAKELIWHVDKNDEPIGSIDRDESRKTGARYRIVRVMVESLDGSYVLLQKRLMTKKSFPGYWDTSAGGNIDYGESYEQAAKRELAEEIGLRDVTLIPVLKFYAEAVDQAGDKLNRFTQLYTVKVQTNTHFIAQPSEVERVEWVKKSKLENVLANGDITDGLKQVIERYYTSVQ